MTLPCTPETLARLATWETLDPPPEALKHWSSALITQRKRIANGWLYRTVAVDGVRDVMTFSALTFVPDDERRYVAA